MIELSPIHVWKTVEQSKGKWKHVSLWIDVTFLFLVLFNFALSFL